ncbi:MAG TPA: Calx-beta domain-containing protein, partial [Anaerolineae bacterium]|nr:Calx-beta domain-containing protein [Anaerolineae bacterium]
DWGCGFVAEGDIQGVAVGVEPLGDNGGPMTPGGVVPTHYPNIEAIWRDIIPVGVNGCGEEMAVDGRGLPRPFASACDSGAVEAFDVMGVVEGGTIMEGNNGLTSLPFTVTLSSLPLVTRTLFYTTVGGTADVDSDYLYRTGSVVVPPNQSEVSWSIPVVNDNVAEETETVVLAVGGRERFWLESTEVVGTILDGDAANQIEVVDWFIWEGHEGATTAWFTVTLTQAAEEVVTVDYLLTEGTATAGEDYEGGYGTITWQIGEQAVLVPVLVYCDYDVESDETVLLLLSGAEGGVLIDNMGVGVIGNDDEEVEPVSWSVYLPGVLKE